MAASSSDAQDADHWLLRSLLASNDDSVLAIEKPEGNPADVAARGEAVRELARRFRDGQQLIEVNRALVGVFAFDQVTAVLCRAARELTGSQGATFVVREGVQVHYADEDAIEPLWKGQRFPIEDCISGWAIANAQPAIIADIYADARIPHAAYRPTFVTSLVMMPVGPGTPVASIGVYWASAHAATAYEVELLQMLASAADLALAGVRAYEEAQRARAEAEQANRVKDELLATLSHELRNPLNSIIGYAELLHHDPGVAQLPQLHRAVAGIHRNARVQAQLVNDLLDLSRLTTGRLTIVRQACNLQPLVDEAVAIVRVQVAAKSLAVAVELDAAPVIASADPVRVQQVLWNLIDNAVKFTPPGGRIVLRLAHDRQGDREVAVLSVADSGQGIDPAFLPRVFDMFQQGDTGTTRRYGGLGAGLALVRQLVQLHDGTVEVHSEGIGHGATFTVRLPIHVGAAVAPDHAGEDMPTGRLAGARILVVDDTEDAAEMLGLLLGTEGAIVATAMSGVDGLRSAEASELDLVISDISMPGMDGYEFLGKLRAIDRHRGTPAIALTGFGRPGDIERARQAGFASHLTKPVDFATLVEIASRSLRDN